MFQHTRKNKIDHHHKKIEVIVENGSSVKALANFKEFHSNHFCTLKELEKKLKLSRKIIRLFINKGLPTYNVVFLTYKEEKWVEKPSNVTLFVYYNDLYRFLTENVKIEAFERQLVHSINVEQKPKTDLLNRETSLLKGIQKDLYLYEFLYSKDETHNLINQILTGKMILYSFDTFKQFFSPNHHKWLKNLFPTFQLSWDNHEQDILFLLPKNVTSDYLIETSQKLSNSLVFPLPFSTKLKIQPNTKKENIYAPYTREKSTFCIYSIAQKQLNIKELPTHIFKDRDEAIGYLAIDLFSLKSLRIKYTTNGYSWCPISH